VLTSGLVPLPDSLLTTEHRDLDLEVVAGTWPDDVGGEVFLSAPAVHPDLSYALFGFGVMIRLSLRPGTHGADPSRFAWRTRTIDSPTRRLHQAAPQAFAPGPLGFTSPLGSPNMVNTAPLPWGDRLFATWDVGRPAELDAVTLGHLGEVGSKQSWGGGTFPADHVLPFIFSSAHPVVDPDRHCLWTVKLTMADGPSFAWQPTVVRYDGDGTEVTTWPVRDARFTGSMHTITQTRDWLVLADSGNFKADPGEMVTGERTVLIDERVPLFLVRKDDLESTPPGRDVPMRSFTLAPPTGHYYACYDDRDGVRIIFEHMDLVDLGYHLRSDDLDVHGRPVNPAHVGMYNMAMGRSSITEVELDPHTGKLIEHARLLDDWSWNHQLSAMDWSSEGISAPTRHHIVFQGFKPGAVSQRALHAYRERVDVSSFPATRHPPPSSACSAARSTRSRCGRSRRWATCPRRPPSLHAGSARLPARLATQAATRVATTAMWCVRCSPTTGSGSTCSTPPMSGAARWPPSPPRAVQRSPSCSTRPGRHRRSRHHRSSD
jgi:all-trans-8'-apo-beta-carotenal 15,15'-oxygenase